MRDKVCSAAEAVGYTTERAMLEMTGDGLLLTEIAPLHLVSVRERVFDHLTRRDVKAVGASLEKLARYLHEQR